MDETGKKIIGFSSIRNVLISLCILIVFAAACSQPVQNPRVNSENFKKITPGMASEEVIRILDQPNKILKSNPCKCAVIETYTYLSGKTGIDVKIFNGKVCDKHLTDFSKYEIRD